MTRSDDANHLVNWFFLSVGAGLLLARGHVRPRWALGLLVAGLGALLAVAWEVGEWATVIRHGTELDTAYTDSLGCLGAAVAAAVIARRSPDQGVSRESSAARADASTEIPGTRPSVGE